MVNKPKKKANYYCEINSVLNIKLKLNQVHENPLDLLTVSWSLAEVCVSTKPCENWVTNPFSSF